MAAPSKQDYKFITRPYPTLLDNIEITGTLLPNRPPLTRVKDGVNVQVQPLKGEDIAWLMELKEVLFFINPDLSSTTDPVISRYNDLGGTVQKFWKLDSWRVQELTYYDLFKSELSSSGMTYWFGRLVMQEKGGIGTYNYLFPVRNQIPDTVNTIGGYITNNDSFTASYLLRPSDMSNVTIRSTNPYTGDDHPLICAPLSETITNYSQVTNTIISLVNANIGRKLGNSSRSYYKYIYHSYSHGSTIAQEDTEWVAETILWQYKFTFDGTRFSYESVNNEDNLKLYIGDLQNPRLLIDFSYECRQQGQIVTSAGVDTYRDVDIDIDCNLANISIPSDCIKTDSSGIRYLDIPAETLSNSIKSKVLQMMDYQEFEERECPVDGSSSYVDSVEIRVNNLCLLGELPSSLPPMAH